MRQALKSAFAAAVLLVSAAAGDTARAEDLTVMISGSFRTAYDHLLPAFEAEGNRVTTIHGASTGTTTTSIPNRLARGEPADVVILSGSAMDELIAAGRVRPESRRELARSEIGMAVRTGAPKPKLATVADLVAALEAARMIAWSSSASGIHLRDTVLPRLGLTEKLAGRTLTATTEPVGAVVARGEADLGFQQISELHGVPGIDLVGPLPREVQLVTPFVAGIAVTSGHREAAARLIDRLASPAAADVIRRSGMTPSAESPP